MVEVKRHSLRRYFYPYTVKIPLRIKKVHINPMVSTCVHLLIEMIVQSSVI